MELQLGLALPSNTVFGFDLNSYVHKPKELSGSGQLSRRRDSCFQLDSPCSSSTDSSTKNKNSKRSFCGAFHHFTTPQTLPLLLWNNHPNDEDDQHSQHNRNDEEEDSDDGIVGWPPIKHGRKRIRRMDNNRRVEKGCADCYGRQSNYVKVKMDGVAIARKIDLTLFTSFQQLKQTLFPMFGLSQENSTAFKLTYQDTEGDWLLADDISWRSFVRSVQRLKLMKNNNGEDSALQAKACVSSEASKQTTDQESTHTAAAVQVGLIKCSYKPHASPGLMTWKGSTAVRGSTAVSELDQMHLP